MQMVREREEKTFSKGGTAMIHPKKKKNPAGVAPSDYREGVMGLLQFRSSSGTASAVKARQCEGKTCKSWCVMLNWFCFDTVGGH